MKKADVKKYCDNLKDNMYTALENLKSCPECLDETDLLYYESNRERQHWLKVVNDTINDLNYYESMYILMRDDEED